MTISRVTVVSAPADNATQNDQTSRALALSGVGVTGDLIVVFPVVRSATETFSVVQTGGQTWAAATLRQGSQLSVQPYYCRFNGTWTQNPSFRTTGQTNIPFSLVAAVYRPTTGTNTWALDGVGAEWYSTFAAPTTPYDVTITGRTALSASTVNLFLWAVLDELTWTLQTAGFTNPGFAQYRNTEGADISVALADKILTSATGTGDVVNREGSAFVPDAGLWLGLTFREQGTGVTVTSAGDSTFYHGETGIQIACSGASASGNTVKISPSNNVADGSAVSQTITAESATSITFTASLSSFTPFAQLYLFVTNGSAESNSSGLPVKRERRGQVSLTLNSLAGTAAASLTGIQYEVRATDLTGTVMQSGTDATTNGSGVMTLPVFTTTDGGALSSGGDVLVTAFYQGANQAASKGTCVQVTPTYS